VSNNRLSAPLSARSLLPRSFNPASSILFRKKCTLTDYARVKIMAALISSPMRCHSVGSGTPNSKPDDAVEYAKFFSRSHDAVIRVYDDVGSVIETHERASGSKEW
jgi:hypothetical protein